MSNDIQPNQPVTLSLHPDTQTIQQTGEKNVFANHMCYNIPIVFGFRRRKLWNSQCLEPEVRL